MSVGFGEGKDQKEQVMSSHEAESQRIKMSLSSSMIKKITSLQKETKDTGGEIEIEITDPVI